MEKQRMDKSLKALAHENFAARFNCCQAVACTCCERFGMKKEDMFRLAEGFGSGIGGLKDTCGAVMGMFFILSLAGSAGDMKDPMRTKLDTYAKFQEAARRFRKNHDSLNCRDLKTEDGVQPLNCCMKCVEDAAEALEEMLVEMDEGK